MMCLEIFGRQGGGAQYGPYRAPPLVQDDLQNATSTHHKEKTKPYLKSNLEICFVGRLLQKLEYAANCGVHTVFFSKRRKNSWLCAHHAAA